MILGGVSDLEQSAGVCWNLSFKGIVHFVVLKVVTAYVIADIKSQNKLCDHYNSHTEFVKRLCHDCLCPTDEGDNPDVICENVLKDDVKSMVDNQNLPGLQSISQHYLQNAMYNFSFGNTKEGIYGANPPDPLHTLELGLYKHLCEGLYTQLGMASMS